MRQRWQQTREFLARLYAQTPWEQRVLISAALLALIPVLAFTLSARPKDDEVHAERAVDTYIPRGFVLVPIEVQNYEALDSILGRFGTVDLFQSSLQEGRKQRLVGRNVRLLRAPQNPSHFAVLIRESEVDRILSEGSLFTVIVKSPTQDGTEFVKSAKSKRRTITYDGGS